MYTITKEQRDRYNATRRAKRAAETAEQRVARLAKRRATYAIKMKEGGEELRKRTRAVALASVHRLRAINPDYESDRYRKSKLKKEAIAADRVRHLKDGERLCPRCLFVRAETDFPITRAGERAHVCSRCFKTMTGGYDIESDRFWVNKANVVFHRAKRRINGVELSKVSGVDLREIYERQDHRCAYCGLPLTALILAVDHKIPLSKGGAHDKSNIQLLCHNCNVSKFTMTDEEYRKYIL